VAAVLQRVCRDSVPRILILLGSRQVDPVYLLQSAAAHLYAVFIILSTLRLDFRFSILSWRRRVRTYPASTNKVIELWNDIAKAVVR
jgi:hypothetical protein